MFSITFVIVLSCFSTILGDDGGTLVEVHQIFFIFYLFLEYRGLRAGVAVLTPDGTEMNHPMLLLKQEFEVMNLI